MQSSSIRKYFTPKSGSTDASQFRTWRLWMCRHMDAWIHFVENTIEEIREKVGDGKVLLALSGGVDSSVCSRTSCPSAIGKQLTCVFVDHGLLRKNEGDEVEGVFGQDGSVRHQLYPRQRTGALLQQACRRHRA